MMKELPFVKHMRTEVYPQRFAYQVPLARFVTADMNLDANFVADRKVSANVHMKFTCVVSEDNLLHGRESITLSEVKRKAIKAFASDLFGPVATELEEVLFLLWEHEIEQAADRIEKLIPILRGDEV